MEVRGFYFAGIHSGIKRSAEKDLGLIYAPDGASCAAAFTTNRFKASHILLDLPRVRRGVMRVLLVNSGNANACVGKEGIKDAKKLLNAVAKELNVPEKECLIASTGIIGERLPVRQIEKRIPLLVRSLSRFRAEHFAEAIMTTDRFMKISMRKLNGMNSYLLGIAKGAGMICPSMSTATMLAFFLTDISASSLDLYSIINKIVDETFNSISVDSQMSTNDSFFFMASGKSGAKISRPSEMKYFTEAAYDLASELAEMIVRDGEGATCVIEVEVREARDEKEAKTAAREVANSILVKTAFHGGDENWGRIVQALGTTKVYFKPEKVKVYVNGTLYFKNGSATGVSRKKKNKREKHHVLIELGAGRASARFLTSDLSEQYVRMNAEYTT